MKLNKWKEWGEIPSELSSALQALMQALPLSVDLALLVGSLVDCGISDEVELEIRNLAVVHLYFFIDDDSEKCLLASVVLKLKDDYQHFVPLLVWCRHFNHEDSKDFGTDQLKVRFKDGKVTLAKGNLPEYVHKH